MTATLGVIFDMDGVLVDSGRAHHESWRRLAAELGRPDVSESQFNALFGSRSAEIIAAWFDERRPDLVKRLDDRKEEIYRNLIRGNLPEMPGARLLIQSLHRTGARVAVGSSGPPENVALVCAEMGLHPILSAVVTGFDVDRGKPDPQVFLIAAERMGVEPSRCVVIEDAPLGIEAARRAGMKSIALTSSHPAESLAAADRIVDRLDDLTFENCMKLVNERRCLP